MQADPQRLRSKYSPKRCTKGHPVSYQKRKSMCWPAKRDSTESEVEVTARVPVDIICVLDISGSMSMEVQSFTVFPASVCWVKRCEKQRGGFLGQEKDRSLKTRMCFRHPFLCGKPWRKKNDVVLFVEALSGCFGPDPCLAFVLNIYFLHGS